MNRVISFKNILSNEFQWLHYLIFWEALSKLAMAGVGEVAVTVSNCTDHAAPFVWNQQLLWADAFRVSLPFPGAGSADGAVCPCLCCSRGAAARRGGADDAAQRARQRRAAEPVPAAEESGQVLL